MSALLALSILIRIAAMFWSIVLWRRLRDWRMAFVTATLALMALRQTLTLIKTFDPSSVRFDANLDELPGLLVSVMALLFVFLLGRMIMEIRERERHLQQMQKLDAVGRLASGIAHDFNNLLTVIRGNSEILLADLPTGSAEHELSKEINDAAGMGAELTRKLMAVARRSPQHTEKVLLNDVVSDSVSMLRRVIPENIELALNLGDEGCIAEVDRGHVEQILVNLVINARDAIESGGRIVVETSVRDYGTSLKRPLGADAKKYALLEVSDNGSGMDAETRSRIFEPFFSTKAPDKGTGLGLASTHAIVTSYSGFIDVESAPGAGTRFRIGLPLATPQVAPA